MGNRQMVKVMTSEDAPSYFVEKQKNPIEHCTCSSALAKFFLQSKIIGEKLACSGKKLYLCRAFSEINYLITHLTYYEPIRNRFHFDSRFV